MADILFDSISEKSNSPKVVILTHGDADGLVAALVVKAFESLNGVKNFLVMCSMDVSHEVTEKTLEYISNYTSLSSRDKLYILDRSIPSCSWLKMRYLNYTKIINIDHHLTNQPHLYENEEICKNIEFVWSDKKSAAYLALDYFEKFNYKEEFKNLHEKLKPLSVATSCWDIFTWKNLKNDGEDKLLKEMAFSINAAEKILGSVPFFDFLEKNLNEKDFNKIVFDYFYKLNDAYKLKINSIYNFAKRSIHEVTFKKYKMAVIYGVDMNYYSIISDMILEEKNNNYDIVAFLSYLGNVSLRSKGDADVSDIASKLGRFLCFDGGGHKNASGCRIFSKDKIKMDMTRVFEDALKLIEYK